jgi:hypothetical protein
MTRRLWIDGAIYEDATVVQEPDQRGRMILQIGPTLIECVPGLIDDKRPDTLFMWGILKAYPELTEAQRAFAAHHGWDMTEARYMWDNFEATRLPGDVSFASFAAGYEAAAKALKAQIADLEDEINERDQIAMERSERD